MCELYSFIPLPFLTPSTCVYLLHSAVMLPLLFAASLAK